MKPQIKIFLDSDVVISSLISTTGAAYFLLQKTGFERYISNLSEKELERVAERLDLELNCLHQTIKNSISVVKVKKTLSQIQKEYEPYCSDINDTHIIGGIITSKANFLISYNLKHYNVEKIQRELDVLVMTPAQFLQYLRSQK